MSYAILLFVAQMGAQIVVALVKLLTGLCANHAPVTLLTAVHRESAFAVIVLPAVTR
jgi:hypothetical protein